MVNKLAHLGSSSKQPAYHERIYSSVGPAGPLNAFIMLGWSIIILNERVPVLSVLLYVYMGSPLPIKLVVSRLTLLLSLNVKSYGGNHIILPNFPVSKSPGPCSTGSRFTAGLPAHARFSIENMYFLGSDACLVKSSVLYGTILTNPLSSSTLPFVFNLHLFPSGNIGFPLLSKPASDSFKPLFLINLYTLSYLSKVVQDLQNVFSA